MQKSVEYFLMAAELGNENAQFWMGKENKKAKQILFEYFEC